MTSSSPMFTSASSRTGTSSTVSGMKLSGIIKRIPRNDNVLSSRIAHSCLCSQIESLLARALFFESHENPRDIVRERERLGGTRKTWEGRGREGNGVMQSF